MHFSTICFLAILSASITVVIGQELPFRCLPNGDRGNVFGYYTTLLQNCDSVLKSIEKWVDAKCAVGLDAKCASKCAVEFDAKCDTKCDAKINVAVNRNYYIKRRTLAFELTNCLKAKEKATCDTKRKCFWLPEGNCVPKDLVP
ncbi:uncharacterized protein LOC133173340 [Saccostrea echinata]|uniref:uncharacterized protein LOC133173340 n=1 Tax=Saccostrea echinata TaxID=191078 RepID=UPI002A7FE9A6|nr:uncharacterized protein LOC133173340 [Saccostrea echinata]